MREITVRKKMVFAYISAAALFVAAVEILAMVEAHGLYFLGAAVLAGVGLFIYATSLKCPHCHARAFSRRWLALFYIPKTCAHCDREFFD
ncbi:MAG: hypothetical protein JSR90_22025 [Proteobacteria bacterium]|nr:hypothetical protein [Pseudomonadota bacterium]